jgi:hypothetical protein
MVRPSTILYIIHRPVFYLEQRLGYGILSPSSGGTYSFGHNRYIRVIGLWQWCINITIAVLDIIYRPVFYLKHGVSETVFCLRLQVEPSQLGTIDK